MYERGPDGVFTNRPLVVFGKNVVTVQALQAAECFRVLQRGWARPATVTRTPWWYLHARVPGEHEKEIRVRRCWPARLREHGGDVAKNSSHQLLRAYITT